jgi:hypothetical protein
VRLSFPRHIHINGMPSLGASDTFYFPWVYGWTWEIGRSQLVTLCGRQKSIVKCRLLGMPYGLEQVPSLAQRVRFHKVELRLRLSVGSISLFDSKDECIVSKSNPLDTVVNLMRLLHSFFDCAPTCTNIVGWAFQICSEVLNVGAICVPHVFPLGHLTGNGFEIGRYGLPDLTNHRFTSNIPTNKNMHLCHACVMWHDHINEPFLNSITLVGSCICLGFSGSRNLKAKWYVYMYTRPYCRCGWAEHSFSC